MPSAVPLSPRLRAVLALAVVLHVALALPAGASFGLSAEEVAGLLDVTPVRYYADHVEGAPGDGASAGGLRRFQWSPVLVLERDGGSFPLMIDGHIGALTAWPYRPLIGLGGPLAARALSVGFGVLTTLVVFALVRRLVDDRAAVISALLVATHPLVVALHTMLRPAETWSTLGPMLFGLLALRYGREPRARTAALGALALGVGVAAKNTAVWTALAALAAAFLLDRIPRLGVRGWALAALAFLLPLTPQLMYLADPAGTSALDRRLKVVAGPWELLRPDRWAFFARHFDESFGGLGTYLGGVVSGRQGPRWDPFPGIGFLYLFCAVAFAVLAFRRASTLRLRFAAAVVGLVLLQYVAFYYEGMSVFGLVAPSVPAAAAIIGVLAWDRVARRAARVAIGAAFALLLVNNVTQGVLWNISIAHADSTFFDLRSQRAVAADLDAAGVTSPWTTTFGVVGVLEVLTDSRVRPRHAFPLYAEGCSGYTPEVVWEPVLDRMGGGRHDVLLSPRVIDVDVSPCEPGERMSRGFYEAVAARRGQIEEVRSYPVGSGAVGLQWLSVDLP